MKVKLVLGFIFGLSVFVVQANDFISSNTSDNFTYSTWTPFLSASYINTLPNNFSVSANYVGLSKATNGTLTNPEAFSLNETAASSGFPYRFAFGLEKSISPAWLLSWEFGYSNFGEQNLNAAGIININAHYTNFDLLAGLGYLFNIKGQAFEAYVKAGPDIVSSSVSITPGSLLKSMAPVSFNLETTTGVSIAPDFVVGLAYLQSPHFSYHVDFSILVPSVEPQISASLEVPSNGEVGGTTNEININQPLNFAFLSFGINYNF